MSTTINIRKYKPEDHKDVNRIFGENMADFQHVKDGIILGWQSPYVITYQTILFFVGFFYSITYGIIALFTGMVFHAIFIYCAYHIYVWDHLNSDMKDPELKYWTKPPGVFLVATTESEKVCGCICYEQINTDTVEMHRLAVDGEFRGLKIGRKLVQALIDTAKENGYDNLYLETSNAQINANQLYQKMDFKFLRFLGLGPGPEWYFTYLSGIKVVSYTMKLK